MQLKQLCGALVAVAACVPAGNEDVTRVDNVGANELGITTLEAKHFEDGGDELFELRGLDVDGNTRGTLRLRVGDVPEFRDVTDWTTSEITIEVGDVSRRLVTRAVGFYELAHYTDATQPFLEVARATLKREANIVVPEPTLSAETAYYAYTDTCHPDLLNVSPVVAQCCYTYDTKNTKFVLTNGNPTQGIPPNSVIHRSYSPWGRFCQRANGDTGCSGQYHPTSNPGGCYYGPSGYAITLVEPPPAPGWNPYISTDAAPQDPNGRECQSYWEEAPLETFYGTLAGNRPLGWGCVNGQAVPGGGASGAGLWDY